MIIDLDGRVLDHLSPICHRDSSRPADIGRHCGARKRMVRHDFRWPARRSFAVRISRKSWHWTPSASRYRPHMPTPRPTPRSVRRCWSRISWVASRRLRAAASSALVWIAGADQAPRRHSWRACRVRYGVLPHGNRGPARGGRVGTAAARRRRRRDGPDHGGAADVKQAVRKG